jgi:hypothetical protein
MHWVCAFRERRARGAVRLHYPRLSPSPFSRDEFSLTIRHAYSLCSAAAWDTVEELSAAASHAKSSAKEDPLEKFCEEDPSADECRVYED